MNAARTTAGGTVALSPHEALARQVILQRVEARHHAPRAPRRHSRAALLLRSLAERLDPAGESAKQRIAAPEPHHRAAPSGARAGSPRPWSAAPRRSPHHHS